MDKNIVITAIKFFKKCLTKKGINISKIILFGSYANAYQTMKVILILLLFQMILTEKIFLKEQI